MDIEKYKRIIKQKTNDELAKYFRTIAKRASEISNVAVECDLIMLIGLIKSEWVNRLYEDDSNGLPSEGLMSVMGYRVGDTQGVKKNYRRLIMREILIGPIPLVGSPAYMREWGTDGSIQRFKKMQRFLKAEINVLISLGL